MEEQTVMDHCRCYKTTRHFKLSHDEEYFLNNTLVKLLNDSHVMTAETAHRLRSTHSCDARHQAMLWETNFVRMGRNLTEIQHVPGPYTVQLMLLAVFFISTGGADGEWEMAEGWMEHYSFCYWFGVE